MLTEYQQAVDYLYTSLPMFQRIGAAAIKKDITNTIRLCEALDNPHKKFKSIHVGGTNGKGSVSHLVASILQAAGYKVGLHTSPHLKNFTERIRVNGQEADKNFVVDFINRTKPLIEEVKPSFFELSVVMAFDYFAREHVDIAVIEVGLGGRLDSTNVITPELSIITNIGWDHTDILGDTLEKIAFEKAGIIKKGVPVVISERQSVVESVFINKAEELHAPLVFASDHYVVKRVGDLISVFQDDDLLLDAVSIPLTGNYQNQNLKGVVAAVDQLNKLNFNISKDALKNGIENVTTTTGLKGRWQKLGDEPLIICDTGHNVDGMREVVAQIKEQSYKKLHMVLGMVSDKDIHAVLQVLPKDATYYFCQAKIPRALDADTLSARAATLGLKGVAIPDVNTAIAQAKLSASKSDFIFIGGSTFVVAEITEL